MATADLTKQDEDSNCINLGRERYIDMMVKNLLDFGLSGWMADFGEYIPLEGRSRCPSKFWGKLNHGRVCLISLEYFLLQFSLYMINCNINS